MGAMRILDRKMQDFWKVYDLIQYLPVIFLVALAALTALLV